ncbi:MAG: GntR family transcriptional regulator, partial [Bacteroidota bacterium]
MLPYKTIIELNRAASKPLYLQLAEEIIKRITSGMIPANTKLPGARKMATLLGVSRKTVIRAYEELDVQDWIVTKPSQGSFVNAKMPIVRPKQLAESILHRENQKVGFELDGRFDFVTPAKLSVQTGITHRLNDGYPDVRLAPLKELSRNLAYLINTPKTIKLMSYNQAYQGDLQLRSALAKYLTETRGIHVDVPNIL